MVTKKPKGLGRGLEALLGPTAAESARPTTVGRQPGPAGIAAARRTWCPASTSRARAWTRARCTNWPRASRRRASCSRSWCAGSATGANAGKYEIIAGERRFRAARLAGLDSVPVLVRDVPDEAAAAMSLIENIQREDLNPLEEAHGLQRLVKEFGLTHEQAAQAVGRSRSAASNLLRLLNLADPVQTMLMAGDLDMGHARALLALERAAQITAANQIAAKKLSVREAESLVKKLGAEFNLVSPKPKKEKSRDLRRVEEELSDLLTAEVEVRVKKRVKRNGRSEEMGEVAIQFGSLEELNGLIDKLRG